MQILGHIGEPSDITCSENSRLMFAQNKTKTFQSPNSCPSHDVDLFFGNSNFQCENSCQIFSTTAFMSSENFKSFCTSRLNAIISCNNVCLSSLHVTINNFRLTYRCGLYSSRIRSTDISRLPFVLRLFLFTLQLFHIRMSTKNFCDPKTG